MSDFVVHTPEQLAAHDAATSKRYLEALRELQAENARLRAFVMEAIDMMSLSRAQRDRWLGKLAALGETNEG